MSLPVGLDRELVLDPQLAEIAPNPSSGVLGIRLNDIDQDIEIKVTNIHGQEIYEGRFSAKSPIEIDLQHLLPGIYLVHLSGNGQSMNAKWIKQ